MNRSRLVRIILVVVLMAFTSLIGWRVYERYFKPAEAVAEEPVAVSVVAATKKDLTRYVKVVGSLQPATASNLALKAAGRVASVPAEIGKAVRKGNPLVVLDKSDLLSQVKAAEAAYELASANLTRIELSAPVMEKAQAESSVKQARAQVDAATKNEERMTALYQAGAVPLVQLEAAQTQLTVALAQLELALQNLDVVNSGTAQQAIAAATAQKKQAEAGLELARSQLAAATLAAPYDGVVSFVNVNPGEIVSPGVPVVGMVESGRLYAEFMVSEKQVGVLKAGQSLEITVPTVGKSATAVVAGISPSVDARSRMYRLRVEVRTAEGSFKPGMMAEARLLEDSRAGCVAIPEECVVGGSVDPSVFVATNDSAEKRPVKLGISDGRYIEILSGVQEGDSIVQKGQTYLKHGAKIKVVDGGSL